MQPDPLLRLSRECSNACGQFRSAARQLDNSGRKAMLLDLAILLERFHQDLEKERQRLGFRREDSANLSGTLSQIAASFVSQIARGNEAAFMKTCESTDEKLVKEFSQVLDQHLDPPTRDLVVHQKRELQQQLGLLHAATSEAELDRP